MKKGIIDKPKLCAFCNRIIYAGESVIVIKYRIDVTICSESCKQQYEKAAEQLSEQSLLSHILNPEK